MLDNDPSEPRGTSGEDVQPSNAERAAVEAQAMAMSMDAGRSAAAILKAARHGQHDTWMALVSTMTELERGYLCGALAAFANQALNMCDQLADIARQHGADVKANGYDVLTAITLEYMQ